MAARNTAKVEAPEVIDATIDATTEEQAPAKVKTSKELTREAYRTAVKRLKAAHKDEFNAMVAEERAARGLDVEDIADVSDDALRAEFERRFGRVS